MNFQRLFFETVLFQSTLPLRGATRGDRAAWRKYAFQSTLPLRGATSSLSPTVTSYAFQSTLPLRGATLVSALLTLT